MDRSDTSKLLETPSRRISRRNPPPRFDHLGEWEEREIEQLKQDTETREGLTILKAQSSAAQSHKAESPTPSPTPSPRMSRQRGRGPQGRDANRSGDEEVTLQTDIVNIIAEAAAANQQQQEIGRQILELEQTISEKKKSK